MKTLDNVVSVLESKGYTVAYDDTITSLNIEDKWENFISVTPFYYDKNGKFNSMYIIPDYIDYNVETLNFTLDSYPYIEQIKQPTPKFLLEKVINNIG